MKEKEKFKIGDKVLWKTVNGSCSGVIYSVCHSVAFVQMTDGVVAIVDFDSLTKVE